MTTELYVFEVSPFGQGGPFNGVVCAPLPAGLGGFFSDATGFAISQHTSDISPVATANPAHPGETITVYADGF